MCDAYERGPRRGKRAPGRETAAPRPAVVACAWCGLLSSDRETWYRPPQWFSLIRFELNIVSHGICPACFSKHVPDFRAPP